ncbi:lytic transglycosylase domain-containing protein [Kitasatospora sp. NPDC059327]|uniref:lytic transglycosylase domain-containing protein n=1 Tax=Kitasatospora sp. NPDC059327 TaxID=3346803 RepID=UPI00367C2E3F
MKARFDSGQQAGRRIRLGKRMTGTAAAFTALAALTGSQVTGLGLSAVAAAEPVPPVIDPTAAVVVSTAALPTTAPDGTALPTLPGGSPVPVDGGGAVPLPQPPTTLPGDPSAGPFRTGPALPATVFAAYRKAETALALRSPACHLPWQLLAAIGEVESGQANRGGVDAAGTTYRPILGPALNGNGFAAISDTDGGRYDGDRLWDRAVGPMQFIPSTWAYWGVDGNGDGQADPNNIFDAAESAGRYLCAGGRDLADPAQLDRAILGYNNSGEYLRTVKNWMSHFGTGTATTTPDRPAPATAASPFAAPPTTVPTPAGTTPATTAPATTAPAPATSPSAPAPAETPTGTPTGAPTTTPTQPPTGTPSRPATTAPTATSSPSPSATTSPSATPTGTPTAAPTGTATATPTGTPSGTPTACATPTATATPTDGASPTASASATATATATATPTAPGCPTPTGTPTATPTDAAAGSASPTPSAALSPSPSAR